MTITLPDQTINLPSFLRRSLKAYALKAHIRELGCELQRIGRSRNWFLKANFEQIQGVITFIEDQGEPSWQWLAKLLRAQYCQLSHSALLLIAKRIPQVTVAKLVTQTDCTLAQARSVIDELEGLD
ncbi:ribosome recycling factor family protein [Colwellia sp. RSH04]|uniref:ribosome recycling factor family protein n=1 Tax=Colwellia sp. RSH04 TaxID=2305464 RepID=UPI00217530E6|nr:ribosome recycling factor family protein [Colwellia sp. RSH04]